MASICHSTWNVKDWRKLKFQEESKALGWGRKSPWWYWEGNDKTGPQQREMLVVESHRLTLWLILELSISVQRKSLDSIWKPWSFCIHFWESQILLCSLLTDSLQHSHTVWPPCIISHLTSCASPVTDVINIKRKRMDRWKARTISVLPCLLPPDYSVRLRLGAEGHSQDQQGRVFTCCLFGQVCKAGIGGFEPFVTLWLWDVE